MTANSRATAPPAAQGGNLRVHAQLPGHLDRRAAASADLAHDPDGWVMPLAPPDWELMEHACTDNNRDAEEGLLQPGALDGSGRDVTAIATPSTYR